MKATSQTPQLEEPVGIVISGGARVERPPVFLAFEWSPAPEPVTESSAEPKAA